MICYKSKFFSIQKYNIFMLKDEIQFSNGQDSFVIQLNSFQPKIKWIKNSNSDIISFELILDKKNSIFRFTPHIGKLLKEFMNGKICYQGINNHYKFAKYIQKRNYGSIVRMRCIENDELVICKIIKQGKEEYEQEFRNELLSNHQQNFWTENQVLFTLFLLRKHLIFSKEQKLQFLTLLINQSLVRKANNFINATTYSRIWL